MKYAMTMLTAAALVAGCAREAAEQDNGSAAALAEVPAPAPEPAGGDAPRSAAEKNSAADRPLPDFETFRVTDAEREGRLGATYDSCMEAAGTTADYRNCSSAEFRRIERDMDQALERAGEGLSASGRARLDTAQRDWREGLPGLCRRELEEQGQEGGTMDLLTLDACALREIVRRTLWLESLS